MLCSTHIVPQCITSSEKWGWTPHSVIRYGSGNPVVIIGRVGFHQYRNIPTDLIPIPSSKFLSMQIPI